MRAESRIRRATKADVPGLVDLHYRVFDQSTHHLLALGRHFLEGAYLWYCSASDAMALVAELEGGMVGCITVSRGGYHRVLLVNWQAVLRELTLNPRLWVYPVLVRRFRTLLTPGHNRTHRLSPSDSPA